jgi:glutathione S-transferase
LDERRSCWNMRAPPDDRAPRVCAPTSDTDAMILYYTPGTCALGAMALLRHTELPFQLCHVPRDARMGPVFRTINPHGHVPTLLTDDDRVVWEASAVLNHIARKAGGSNLLPKAGSAAEDELFQWYSYLASEFHAAFYPVFKPQLFLRDETAHEDLRRDSLKNVRRQLAYIDVHLEDRRHVMGDTFGVLDAYLFSMARWGERFFDFQREFPSLARYLERMRAEPSIAFALAIEAGEEVPIGKNGYKGPVDLMSRQAL